MSGGKANNEIWSGFPPTSGQIPPTSGLMWLAKLRTSYGVYLPLAARWLAGAVQVELFCEPIHIISPVSVTLYLSLQVTGWCSTSSVNPSSRGGPVLTRTQLLRSSRPTPMGGTRASSPCPVAALRVSTTWEGGSWRVPSTGTTTTPVSG